MVDGRGVHGYVIVRFAIFVPEISVSAPFPSPDDPYEHSVVAFLSAGRWPASLYSLKGSVCLWWRDVG